MEIQTTNKVLPGLVGAENSPRIQNAACPIHKEVSSASYQEQKSVYQVAERSLSWGKIPKNHSGSTGTSSIQIRCAPKSQQHVTTSLNSTTLPKLLDELVALILSNISPSQTPEGKTAAAPGTVVASTAPQGGDTDPKKVANYWYNWTRDAALTMDVVLRQIGSGNVDDNALYQQMGLNYITTTIRHQQDSLGVAKARVDGSAYGKPWGEPQNDGPALRASALLRLAKKIVHEQSPAAAQKILKRMHLFGDAKAVINKDLDYVIDNVDADSYDVWEMVKGQHFTTLLFMHAALSEGAALATELGDKGAADRYSGKLAGLEARLDNHWDAEQGIFRITLNRDPDTDDANVSGLDSAVIIAALRAGRAIAVTDDRVLSTFQKLREFSMKFPINQDPKLPGVAIARHDGDHWDGLNIGSAGNPWVLTTAYGAELYYQVANAAEEKGELSINQLNRDFFTTVAPKLKDQLQEASTVNRKSSLFRPLVEGLRHEGDALINRVLVHRDTKTGTFPEQYDKDSGAPTGPRHLTWSAVAIFTALEARGALARSENPKG